MEQTKLTTPVKQCHILFDTVLQRAVKRILWFYLMILSKLTILVIARDDVSHADADQKKMCTTEWKQTKQDHVNYVIALSYSF